MGFPQSNPDGDWRSCLILACPSHFHCHGHGQRDGDAMREFWCSKFSSTVLCYDFTSISNISSGQTRYVLILHIDLNWISRCLPLSIQRIKIHRPLRKSHYQIRTRHFRRNDCCQPTDKMEERNDATLQ